MTRTHDAPKGRKRLEPLYDLDIPTPTHSERARTLVIGEETATLCTVAREPVGHPYGSFITFAMHGSRPVFLVSKLAEHTRNMLQDDKVSLLVAESGSGDPLGRGRVTLVGHAREVSGEEADGAREAYLAVHPNASYYVDFRDFSFWTIDVDAVRYIGGFGRMSWVEPSDWSTVEPDPLVAVAEKIVGHMNDDHEDAMRAICLAYSRAENFESVKMTGIDRYGIEMSVGTDQGPRSVRVAFEQSITSAAEARKSLVALTNAGRERLGITKD